MGFMKRVTDADKAVAVKLYQDTDMTADEIAARYGVARSTVHRWIQASGVPLRGARGPRPEVSRDEAAAEVLEALRALTVAFEKLLNR